jgi:hypothetical protein
MNEPLMTDEALRRRTDDFLERVRRTGQHATTAIAEAVVASTQRLGRRPDDPVLAMSEAALESLRAIEREARRAIVRVETITEEYQRHGRGQIVIVAGPAADERREPVFPGRDPIAADYHLSGHRPEQPESARGEDRPQGA